MGGWRSGGWTLAKRKPCCERPARSRAPKSRCLILVYILGMDEPVIKFLAIVCVAGW